MVTIDAGWPFRVRAGDTWRTLVSYYRSRHPLGDIHLLQHIMTTGGDQTSIETDLDQKYLKNDTNMPRLTILEPEESDSTTACDTTGTSLQPAVQVQSLELTRV